MIEPSVVVAELAVGLEPELEPGLGLEPEPEHGLGLGLEPSVVVVGRVDGR